MQPILPIFFNIQFNFLYEGYRNDFAVDLKAGLGLLTVGGLLLLLGAGAVGEVSIRRVAKDGKAGRSEAKRQLMF